VPDGIPTLLIGKSNQQVQRDKLVTPMAKQICYNLVSFQQWLKIVQKPNQTLEKLTVIDIFKT